MKETLIYSAQIYYNYLKDNNLGLDEIKILDFSLLDSNIYLSIKEKIYNLEGLILKVDDEDFVIGEDGLEQKYFDERAGILCLGVGSELYKKLSKVSQDKLSLFSDLKFLVKNVQDFFQATNSLGFPTKNNDIEPKLSKNSTPEQNIAIKNIFSHPFTYVWGPPGSGKTQVVLFESLLNFIHMGKRVCVLAPTNNALEQVLKTLIKKFDSLGLNREKILRLGMPTNEFLNAYIEVCDPNILKKTSPQNLFSYVVSLKDRLQEAFVVGMTVDGFIRKYRTLETKFEHIFLDECAFTPLIKACTLCVDDIPLTFLGDHKQLSPICEMPNKEISKDKNFYVKLWNLSALNLEEFLISKSFDKQNPIFNKNPYQDVNLEKICVSKLTKTHRYGNNLAKILDDYIYKNGLCGIDEHTELFYVDSKQNSNNEKHISINEANSASELAQFFKGRDYAVLTPFVNQRKQMINAGIPRNKVWTIHSSQGQEFDTVIFSPVCLHYYLTNSYNISALYALNVAISRIKKQLIIVCDYDFWKLQNGQFLTNILKSCKPFDKSKILPF